jgi:hypothetical protein
VAGIVGQIDGDDDLAAGAAFGRVVGIEEWVGDVNVWWKMTRAGNVAPR